MGFNPQMITRFLNCEMQTVTLTNSKKEGIRKGEGGGGGSGINKLFFSF